MTDEEKPERESNLELREVRIDGLDDESRRFAENEIQTAFSVLKGLDVSLDLTDED